MQNAYIVAIVMGLAPVALGEAGGMEDYARGAGIDGFIDLYTARNDAIFQASVKSLKALSRGNIRGIEWRKLAVQATIMDAVLHCRYTDLIVAAQPLSSPSADQPLGWSSDELILSSGVPCLFVPENFTGTMIGERVLIAWNESREARRALIDALPFIHAAHDVVVLMINPRRSKDGGDPAEDLQRFLEHHRVKATIEVHNVEGSVRSRIILQRCEELDVKLLVMGAYGQPHLRKFFAGSATDRILRSASIPVLCSH
jgi:nucleotide-binding universal stress UspA family protein